MFVCLKVQNFLNVEIISGSFGGNRTNAWHLTTAWLPQAWSMLLSNSVTNTSRARPLLRERKCLFPVNPGCLRGLHKSVNVWKSQSRMIAKLHVKKKHTHITVTDQYVSRLSSWSWSYTLSWYQEQTCRSAAGQGPALESSSHSSTAKHDSSSRNSCCADSSADPKA